MIAHPRIAGVVLGAGLSTRMGRTKQLVTLDGETLIARAARTACDAGLDPVVVVVGHDADQVRAAVAHLPVITVENPDPARGIHTSLRVGFAALAADPSIDAGVVLLGDMPLVTAQMVDDLVTAWTARRPPLAVSLYDDVIAPPVLYGAALFAELAALDDEGGGKRVIQRHRHQAVEVRWPASALTDVDAPADLERLTRR